MRLGLQFAMPRPASHTTSRGAMTKSAPAAHICKPDIDNLAKAVMDALTDAGAWRDDCQIVELTIGDDQRISRVPLITSQDPHAPPPTAPRER